MFGWLKQSKQLFKPGICVGDSVMFMGRTNKLHKGKVVKVNYRQYLPVRYVVKPDECDDLLLVDGCDCLKGVIEP